MSDQIKSLLEEQARAWEEFKQTNAERIRQEAKGAVDPLITEKLARLNQCLDAKQDAVNAILTDVQAKVNRLETGGVAAKGDGLTPDQREHKQAFSTYVRKGQSAGLSELQVKAMSVGSDPDGGYLVPADTSGRIVSALTQLNPIRQFASVTSISVDALEGLRDLEDVSGGWVAETGSRTTHTTTQLGKWEIRLHEYYIQPAATQKLLDMATLDVEGWLSRKVSRGFSKATGTAYTTGNGIGKPRGFASYSTAATADSSRSWGVFEHVATGTSGGFGTDPNGLQKMLLLMSKLDERFEANAAFYANRTTKWALRGLTDASSAGKFVFIPSFVAGMPDTVLGREIRTIPDMATYTTADALAIAYGDMAEAYQIVDGVGIRVLRDPFTSKPYVLFYTTAFFGGDVVDFNALKFLKFGTS